MALAHGLSDLQADIKKSKISVMLAMLLSKYNLISEVYFLFGPELFLKFLFAFQGRDVRVPKLKELTTLLKKISIFMELYKTPKSEVWKKTKELADRFQTSPESITTSYNQVHDEYVYLLNLIEEGDV